MDKKIDVQISNREDVNYWVDVIQNDLNSFRDTKSALLQIEQLVENKLLRHFCIDDTGIFFFLVLGDFQGGLVLSEMVFYIKPQYRGSLKLVRKYLNIAEFIARKNSCNRIVIGGNINYKDQSFIKLLKRWGYKDDTVSKIL